MDVHLFIPLVTLALFGYIFVCRSENIRKYTYHSTEYLTTLSSRDAKYHVQCIRENKAYVCVCVRLSNEAKEVPFKPVSPKASSKEKQKKKR